MQLPSSASPLFRGMWAPRACSVTIECQMGRSRSLGQKLHGRGLNRRLTKGASTSHFFSFTTAIDQGMTSVNQLQYLDPGIENNRDVLNLSTNISKPNCNLSKSVPTSRNQPQHLEPSTNISKPTSGDVSKPTNGDTQTMTQHLDYLLPCLSQELYR